MVEQGAQVSRCLNVVTLNLTFSERTKLNKGYDRATTSKTLVSERGRCFRASYWRPEADLMLTFLVIIIQSIVGWPAGVITHTVVGRHYDSRIVVRTMRLRAGQANFIPGPKTWAILDRSSQAHYVEAILSCPSVVLRRARLQPHSRSLTISLRSTS